MNDMPIPPGCERIADDPSRLSGNEVQMILARTLLPRHAADPNVLRFIDRYLDCRDAKQAAVEAGLTPASGRNLLHRADIFSAITEVTRRACMKYGYSAEETVERVKEVASLDPGALMRPDGSYVESLRELPPEVRRGIKKFKAKNIYEKDPNGMEQVVGRMIEVEFWDKMKAIELLGREKQLFKETKVVENDVTNNMASLLLGAAERASARAASLLTSPRDVTPDE